MGLSAIFLKYWWYFKNKTLQGRGTIMFRTRKQISFEGIALLKRARERRFLSFPSYLNPCEIIGAEIVPKSVISLQLLQPNFPDQPRSAFYTYFFSLGNSDWCGTLHGQWNFFLPPFLSGG